MIYMYIHVYVVSQREIQVKMILTEFDSQFPLFLINLLG